MSDDSFVTFDPCPSVSLLLSSSVLSSSLLVIVIVIITPSPEFQYHDGNSEEDEKEGDHVNDDVYLLVSCLTSQQHASVSQGRICLDNCTCCDTETEVADQTFYLTQSQYTDTGLTSPSTDPVTPGAWQGSHWSANFEVTGMTRPG